MFCFWLQARANYKESTYTAQYDDTVLVYCMMLLVHGVIEGGGVAWPNWGSLEGEYCTVLSV
jgi:hypothetical protein